MHFIYHINRSVAVISRHHGCSFQVVGAGLAESNGVRAGDNVLSINNQPTDALTHEQATNMIIQSGNRIDMLVQRYVGDNTPASHSPSLRHNYNARIPHCAWLSGSPWSDAQWGIHARVLRESCTVRYAGFPASHIYNYFQRSGDSVETTSDVHSTLWRTSTHAQQ